MFNKFSEEINSLIVFFQFFGLAPFARDQNLSRILYIYSLLHLFAIIMVFISGVFIHDIFTDNFGSLSTIVGGLVFSGLLFCHFLVVLHAFTSRKEQMEIFDKFDEIDNIFQKKLNVSIKYVDLKRKYRNKIIVVCVVLLIIKAIFIGAIFFNLPNPSYWIHCFYSLFVIRARCIQNMFYVDLVTDKVEMINSKLNEIISLDKDKTNKIIFLERYQNNDFKIYKKPIYDQVQLLKQAYGFVWDITNLINDSFGWSLLAITTQGFIEFTSNGYWLFLSLEGLIGDNMALIYICSIVPVVYILSVLANSCSNCTDSAITTGGLVHKIEKEIGEELHNSLVREFSLQIIHEPISISANGFFTINFTLLGSMAAATVTYLVILIQFQLSEKKKAVPVNITAVAQ